VRRPVVRRVALGLVLAAALPVAALAATLTVTTTADVVNGDVASPGALVAAPGPDGIALREALLAAENAPGPHTITFAPALAGQTIVLASRFAPIFRDGITVTGLGAGGEPTVTIDASQASGDGSTFLVAASGFLLSRLRFTFAPVVQIGGAGFGLQGQPVQAPPLIHDIQISDNVFTNVGHPDNRGFAVLGGGSNTDAAIRNVRIVRNVVQDYVDCGICFTMAGTNHILRDITVAFNTFTDVVFPVELGTGSGSGNEVLGGRIVGNTVAGAVVALALIHGELRDDVPPASGNLIEDTLIARNLVVGELDSIVLIAGQSRASDNTLRDTRIVNTAVRAGRGIHVIGGNIRGPGSPTGNLVDGVAIVNTTLVASPQAAVRVDANLDGSAGNAVSGVTVTNSVLLGPDEIAGAIAPDQVSFSRTDAPGFAGVNGNLAADPLLVDPDQGDLRLQAGSPAIGAGTAAGAPARDLECRVRPSPPSIGAYEPGAAPADPADCGSVLAVALTGPGAVASAPAGIACGATCAAAFGDGTDVTLTATADPGAAFTGWDGVCAGTGPCRVTVVAATAVTATFAPLRALTVTRAGAGSGAVSSDPAGIDCGATCAASFASGTTVTLAAAAAAGSNFAGWSGAGCAGTGSCTLALTADTAVQATFVPAGQVGLTVVRAGEGTGAVTSDPAGIDCGATCLAVYPAGAAVVLTAVAATGSTFTGWSGGGCAGVGTCTPALGDDVTVTATFALQTFALTVATRGSAGGTVTSAPAGLACALTCSASFPHGTLVTLTAAAAGGATFREWTGDCSGASATCAVTMTSARSVGAVFSRTFADAALTAQLTPIRAVHVTQLREAVDTLRARNAGLPAVAWTDPALGPGAVVRRVHVAELRVALAAVADAVGEPPPAFTDPALTAGQTPVKAAHVLELRSAVRALEPVVGALAPGVAALEGLPAGATVAAAGEARPSGPGAGGTVAARMPAAGRRLAAARPPRTLSSRRPAGAPAGR
jgi:hypothetical protein